MQQHRLAWIIGISVAFGMNHAAWAGHGPKEGHYGRAHSAPTSSAPPVAFDLDHGNIASEIVVGRAVQSVLGRGNLGTADAPIILHAGVYLTNAWFDAIAPYHPSAVGVYSRLGRRPASEGVTNRNKNIAVLYASYEVLRSFYPAFEDDWKQLLSSIPLDKIGSNQEAKTAMAIGKAAGEAVFRARARDGMNALGNEGRHQHHRSPYADYLGYESVNTPGRLVDASRWQPAIVTKGNGVFQAQQFIAPQMRVAKPYSYDTPDRFQAPVPFASQPKNRDAYRQQADEVLAKSAALTDEQKMTAEFFDNKINSLGGASFFVTGSKKLTLEQFIQYDFLVSLAGFDGGIIIWKEKHRYDAIRPSSVIRHLYGDRELTAWGGAGKGTVNDMRGSEWRSYLNTGDHPEYPSGSACFCSAHAQASRRYLGTDNLHWMIPVARGASQIEPGVTPASDIKLEIETWTDFEQKCGQSRLWGGVHFEAAVAAGHKLCKPIGDTAYEFVMRHIEGRVQ